MNSTTVKLSKIIQDKIADGNILHLFESRYNMNVTHTVRFPEEAPPEDAFMTRYVLQLGASIGSKTELVCIFPNHPKEKSRILRASSCWSLDSLNKTINERFRESLEDTAHARRIKFAIAYGDVVYACADITGTIYVFWASYINVINNGNIANTQYREWPIVCNYNGQYKPKAIFIPKKEIMDTLSELHVLPMADRNPVLMFPKIPVLVCETKPPPEAPKMHIETLTRYEAMTISTMVTKDVMGWLPHQKNPLGVSGTESDPFMVMEGDDADNHSVSISMESPRGYAAPPPPVGGGGRYKHTIPPDPFKEENSEYE